MVFPSKLSKPHQEKLLLDRTIRLRNVRVNNLKNIDLDIPHGQWLAICGLSGSGKSSLAFDTLYAEGQRRYIDCLSPGTRKFFSQLDKPAADLIDGLPPAIAVQPPRGTPDRRTTVGNATEIVEHLRLLFTRVGNLVCPSCCSAVTRDDAETVAGWLEVLPRGTKYLVAFQSNPSEPIDLRESLLIGRRNGFLRAIVNDRTVNLDSASDWPTRSHTTSPYFVVDRLTAGTTDRSRVTESLETAFQFGAGTCVVLIAGDLLDPIVALSMPFLECRIDGNAYQNLRFSRKLICSTCGRLFPMAEPTLFSFNKQASACGACGGVGYSDDELMEVCSICSGSRLTPAALAFQIGGLTIAEVCRLTIEQAADFFQQLSLTASQQVIARLVLVHIQSRLQYLQRVGLGYLTLDRPIRTLSGGELQRVLLTTCLSSTLVNLLYVLDEPTNGLHPHDVARLITSIQCLKARGNTVVVVDHDEELIRAASRIIEIGPAGGAAGGEIVFEGSAAELERAATITGDYLGGRRGMSSGAGQRRQPRGKLRLTGARGHNLKQLDVEFPLGCLCVVAGVSGAGKSSLVQQTLYGALVQRLENKSIPTLPYDDLFGESSIDEVVLIDQSPIGRTGRSNPVTYVQAFADIRQAFAETPDAKSHQFEAGQFSFNVPGGRCEKCLGTGQLTFDMQFLADIYLRCDDCDGTRYRDATLAVRYRGRNIAEVLDLTVREAFLFFRGQPQVQTKLKALIDVGLEYIRLGQSATTLSAGEAQRLRLAVFLNASKKKRALFMMDEPTAGLHMADITKLLDCFEALMTVGHSFLIVEHNLQLMKYADWIIDLGPGAAGLGGQVVACGTPEQLAANPASITGQYLSTALARCVPD